MGGGVFLNNKAWPPSRERATSRLQESDSAAALRPSSSSPSPPFNSTASFQKRLILSLLVFFLFSVFFIPPPFQPFGPSPPYLYQPSSDKKKKTQKKSEFRAPLIDSGGVALRSGPGVTCRGIQRSPGFKNVGHLKWRQLKCVVRPREWGFLILTR